MLGRWHTLLTFTLVGLVLAVFQVLSYSINHKIGFKKSVLLDSEIMAIRPENVCSMKLPEKIIVGYANWNQCDDSLVEAVERGVNVLIWFSINLSVDADGNPLITNGPDLDCVRVIQEKIRDKNLSTIHLISIGGWNSPHPDTTNSAEDVYRHWVRWSGGLFDGFDWDIEGNDDRTSNFNHFTLPCLELMGEMSQLAKKDGFIVGMAPAESYLDPTTSAFDLSLTHGYTEWSVLQPDFAYHGHNVYAYLLLNYGSTKVTSNGPADGDEAFDVDTFDFVTIQLYEGYSHAEYNITVLGQSPVEYLVNFVKGVHEGWDLLIHRDVWGDAADRLAIACPGMCTDHGEHSVARARVDRNRLVIGLANGWAGDGKFLYIPPTAVRQSYEALGGIDLAPRGFAFWNIKDEGLPSRIGPAEPVWMAAGLNDILEIRPRPHPDVGAQNST